MPAAPLAPHDPGATPTPPRAPGLAAGLAAPFGGLAFLSRTPAAWPLAVVPVVVVLGLFVVLSAAGVAGGAAFVRAIVGEPASSLGAVGTAVLRVLLALVALGIAAVVAMALAQPISGPALDGIVRLVERGLGSPERAPEPAWAGVLRSLRVNLLGLVVGVPVLVALALVDLLVPAAAPVTVPLSLGASALLVSWDLFDYPLSARKLGVRERLAWFRSHLGLALGFGLSVVLVSLVPCAGLLFLPAGVAGAAALVTRTDAPARVAGPPGATVSPR